jgi:AcrR family transcriptional regulator
MTRGTVPYTASMARWQQNPSQRLVLAALELFEERGYERTTVVEIAERAGLTKSTFFRHFQDKREVLFGGDSMAGLLAGAIEAAPAGASPFEAVAQALEAVGAQAFTPARRELVVRRQAVIAANPELREREALKGLGLIASMSEALKRRGVPDLTSAVAAHMGALAMAIAYRQWAETQDGEGFAERARRTLAEAQAAAGSH